MLLKIKCMLFCLRDWDLMSVKEDGDSSVILVINYPESIFIRNYWYQCFVLDIWVECIYGEIFR